ncbi:PcfJ domain-containing protein [Aquimarina sediminis]|uniref:PcfJ domain-containing protein n=1 Tax=Aquimarina sediminis TaxID=2070536 RepID=UPI000CA075DA|nr:PcfJ domain-containing protein [Aquimarina sediminis]
METLLEKKVLETKDQTKDIAVFANKYVTLVEEIYTANNKPQGYTGTIASMLWMFFSKMSKKRNTWKRKTFKNLLLSLHNQGCYTILRRIEYVEVLSNISSFGNRFVRNIENWHKETYVAEDQLLSLIEFCFAKYDVPKFLASSFFETQKKHMLWYVQLGIGKSVKSLSGVEIAITSRMAHEFRHTPKGYSVPQALRRAQAIGYGANKEMAEAIAWSGLSRINRNEEFWNTVVQFFAKQKEVPFDKMGEILDYLSFSIREHSDFSMRGRTLEALTRQSDEWHRRMYMQRNAENDVGWKSSKIKQLSYSTLEDEVTITYKIVELLNAQELYEEGYDMCHCVASYVDECFSGTSAIFSLRKYTKDSFEKLVTIEVDPVSREIIQAKSKHNEALSKEAEKIVEIWMKQVNLKQEEYLYTDQYEVRPEQHDQMNVFLDRTTSMQETSIDTEISAKTIFFIIYAIVKLMIVLSQIV